MTNLFIQEPIYLTLDEYRESSNNENIKDLSPIVDDNDVKIIISKAEQIIDGMIGDYGIVAVEGQKRIFPILNEETLEAEEIPLNIKLATVLLSDSLYEGGILDGGAYEGNISGPIKSETYRGHSVAYFGQNSEYLWANRFINEEILVYLKGYLSSLSSKWFM